MTSTESVRFVNKLGLRSSLFPKRQKALRERSAAIIPNRLDNSSPCTISHSRSFITLDSLHHYKQHGSRAYFSSNVVDQHPCYFFPPLLSNQCNSFLVQPKRILFLFCITKLAFGKERMYRAFPQSLHSKQHSIYTVDRLISV
jgi:hypothetical protein